jgi:poly(A) polymerase
MDEPADFRNKPPCSREDALGVLTRLRDAGHVAYFAGGCVRDLLMGLEPKDYDVATDAPPKRVRELFQSTQAVGAAFGVILVRVKRSVVEVATFRAEGKYDDGRRPSDVRYTTAEEDAQRRDFTINGLFLDPLPSAPPSPSHGTPGECRGEGSSAHTTTAESPHGRVIDFVGGLRDLRDRTLRAIGDPLVRFAEDYLRLLRAVRFAARFSLTIDPGTADAIRKRATLLVGISPERIAEELRLMLMPPTRSTAWRLLNDFRLTPILFRFVSKPKEAPERNDVSVILTARGPDSNSIFDHTTPGQPIPFPLSLASASLSHLHPLVPDVRELTTRPWRIRIADALRKSLKISNDESEALDGTLGGIDLLLRDDFPTVATMKRFLARPTAPLSRALLAALATAGLHTDRVRQLESLLRQLENTDFAPAPLITGDDLTAAGLRPGPKFKRLLDLVYDAQLEGRVMSKQEALNFALELEQKL